MNLALYVDRAAKKAARHEEPLAISRQVRDVASVHKTLWPVEEGGELIEGAILVGTAKVTPNTMEIEAMAREVDDVRAELPDQGPAGD
jgi:hypothetical protein